MKTMKEPVRRPQSPLQGQRVVVTRSREQAPEFAGLLAGRGAHVLGIPVIRTAPPSQIDDLKDALLGLNSYEWLVFTSVNGVNEFFRAFFALFDDLRDIGGVRIAAVGPATAARIKEHHLRVDLMPEDHSGAGIARAFKKDMTMENVTVCLMRAENANPDLPEALEELGAIVDDVPCYSTQAETGDGQEAGRDLEEHGADWITFTSGSAVEFFHKRFPLPALLKKHPGIKLASIGAGTSKALLALGLKPQVECKKHTLPAMVDAMAAFLRKS
jgi:uroporphyrinogen III methyltransferase/synthase